MKRALLAIIVLVALGAAACGGTDEPASAGASDAPAPAPAPSSEAPSSATATPDSSGGNGQPSPTATPDGSGGAPLQPTPQSQVETAPSQPSETVRRGGTFTRLWSDPPTLDPHLTGDTTSAGIVVELFSGLVALNTDLRLVPDIAESWEIQDGMVYTFKLRDNVFFHNGKQVTAHDFKWSLERAAAPATASPVADTYLNDLVGAQAFIDGLADEIEGVRVIDDLTLQLTLDAPKAYFLAKLTYPTAYVLDREVVEQGGRSWWLEDPVGTGPFKLSEYRIGERIILTRYDNYYREPAFVDEIFFNLAGGQPMAMYENDEIDFTGVSMFDLDRVLDPSEPLNRELVVSPPEFSVSYIGFNASQAPFDDVRFRQALNHAIDKDLIATEVLSDLVEPAYSILPPEFPGSSPDISGLRYDPDLAKQLLADSAYADPDSRPRIVITVPGTGGTIGLDLEVIIEMWRQTLGVEVEIQQVEWATYLEDLDAKKFQAYAGLGWEADYPDPQDFLDILFHTESSLNHGAYSNLEVDAVLEEARIEADPVRRVALYNQAENLIVNDAAWVPLWFTGDRYVLIKNRVEGYQMTPMIIPKLRLVRIEG